MKHRHLSQDAEKKTLIDGLSAVGTELVIFFDEMPDRPDCVQLRSEKVGVIVAPYDYERLEEWWYYGNWLVVSPAVTGFEPLDTFRSTLREVTDAMRASGVSLLIDCFHDDVEWNVYEDV